MAHQRLLDIAIAEFGARGLEGASTRAIAQAAGTAMSSITYHYGGKDGLYLAAADYIAGKICEDMVPVVVEGSDLAGLTRETARGRVHGIIGRFTDMLASSKNASWSLFIAREQMEPTEAFERIYGGLMHKMLATLVELICVATGRDAATARIVVATLIGQSLALRSSRATVLKLLDCPNIDTAAAALKSRIAANTDAILDRLIAERQELP